MPNLPIWIVLVPLGAFVMVAALVWMGNRRKVAEPAFAADLLQDVFVRLIRAPFARLPWVELVVYAGVGIAIAAVALWAAIAWFS